MADPTAEERRLARGSAVVKIVRPGDDAQAAADDAKYWEHIPINSRAEFVWRLSVEVYALGEGRR